MAILENIMSNIYMQQKPEPQKKEATSEPKSMAAIRNQMIKTLLSGTETTVRGEVTDLRQNQITISLPNGETITARTATTLPLNIGQTADFVVAENDGKTLTLKLLDSPEDSAATETQNAFAKKILTDNNIGINEKNLSIVNTLMQHSQAVSRPNIQKYISMSFKYPEANPKDLIRMDINKIPVNNETVKAFSEINAGQGKLTSEINKTVIEINSKLSEIEDPALRESFSSELSDILEYANGDKPIDSTYSTQENSVNNTPTATDVTVANTTVASQPQTENTSTIQQTQASVNESIVNGNPNTSKETDTPSTAEKYNSLPTDKSNYDTTSSENNSAPKTTQLKEDAFFLEPKEFESKDNVNKLYSSLRNTSEKLSELSKRIEEEIQKQALKQTATINERNDSSILMAQTSKLTNSMHFMDLLNGVFPYMQLPVKLKEENAQGELYVYKKKGGSVSSDSLSCLLHLDLDHLGPTDIYVKLSGKKVHTAFTVATETSEKIFTSEMPALSTALSKKGYELTNDIKIKEAGQEQAPLLSDFLENATPGSVERYSFDMRA